MIKTIQKGYVKDIQEEKYEERCPYCLCHFSYQIKDLRPRPGFSIRHGYIDCPDCGKEIQVLASDGNTPPLHYWK